MDEQLLKLNNDLEAAVAEVKSLAAKSDATPEQLDAAKSKMNACKSRIEAYKEASDVDTWQNETPAAKSGGTVPATARNTSTPVKQGGVDTPGAKGKVGETEIDLLTGEIVSETGAGILSAHQVKSTIDPEYSQGFNNWLRAGGNEAKMKGAKSANDALLEGRDEQGGIFVPAELVAGVIRREPTPTRIVDLVRTITIGSDKAMMVRANYDSDDFYASGVRIYKTGEGQPATKTDKPVFGTKSIDVHGWTAEISISNRLLEDTNFDLMGYLAEEFRTAYRNLAAQKVLLGSGVNEHFGIITRALAAKADAPEIIKSGDANLLTWDGLRKIKNAVPEQYDENCRWLFNKKSTMDAIEGFKDADNRDLWPEAQRSGGVNGTPGKLRGYDYSLEAFMPNIAANAIPLLFGDFRGYARVIRTGISMKVLREIEARSGMTVFLAELREGGDVIEAWKMKAQKIAA